MRKDLIYQNMKSTDHYPEGKNKRVIKLIARWIGWKTIGNLGVRYTICSLKKSIIMPWVQMMITEYKTDVITMYPDGYVCWLGSLD